MGEQVLEQSFAVPSPANLSLRNIRGKVTVRPAEDGQLSVTAVKFLDDGEASQTGVEMWQSDAGNVFVATRFQRGPGPGKPCRVDYDVRLPAPCTLALRCVTGGALLERLDGTFRVKMVSGRLSLEGLDGSLWVRSVSGDITATHLGGRLHLETVSGNVEVRAARLDAVEARTVSGRLSLETPLGGGPYSFQSVSGPMRLLVPPETRCTVEMQSITGRLRMNGAPRAGTPVTGRQEATLGGGGTLVSVHSVSADFALA